MRRQAALAVLLLLLAAVAQAVDIDKAREATEKFLKDAKAAVWLASLFAVGLMLADVVYVLLIKRQGINDLFGSKWFLLPLLFVTVPIVLGVVAKFSPEVKAIYDVIVADGCPFLYCPE